MKSARDDVFHLQFNEQSRRKKSILEVIGILRGMKQYVRKFKVAIIMSRYLQPD
jgi:hypothetical protein